MTPYDFRKRWREELLFLLVSMAIGAAAGLSLYYLLMELTKQ